jgi:F0F1-type ATP synthase membrane subunit b/b'
MANQRRKRWARREPNLSPTAWQQQDSGEVGDAEPAVGAFAEHPVAENAPPGEVVDERAPAENTDSTEAELPADLSDVGAEVGAVLKSAREAAARIRRVAHEEAAKIRDDAKSAAEAAVAEASQIAAADRGEGERIRAEAEAYAEEMRAAADTFAEQARTEAKREAAEIVEHASKRLEAADAEVEERLRQVERKARERLEALQAGSTRYEGRLESMLVVCRGMSSQLEELLGKRDAESGGDPEAVDETLEDALQPDSVRPSSR